MDKDEIFDKLIEAIRIGNKNEVKYYCTSLIGLINNRKISLDLREAENLAEQLKRKLYFKELSHVTNSFILSGDHSLKLKRYYAQSLIEQGQLLASISYLESLIEATPNIYKSPDMKNDSSRGYEEFTEFRGLLGRTYKQIFVNSIHADEYDVKALNQAISIYLSPYKERSLDNYWHGINYVALLSLALRKTIKIENVSCLSSEITKVANNILSNIQSRWINREVTLWDSCTAMEACIALSMYEDACVWLNRYLREPQTDAFELRSTLRQLEEVWELTANTEPGISIIPLIQSELLQKDNGTFEIEPKQMKDIQLNRDNDIQYEKVFGEARYHSYSFIKKAIMCAHNVARIEKDPGIGFGTGFLLKGNELHPSFGDKVVLLTNSHVISDSEEVRNALSPDEATITLELGKQNESFELGEVLWTSPPENLDVSIIDFDGATPELSSAYSISKRLPLADCKQRVYVIGHPKGGGISFSMQDNILLDHESPFIHYRTATEGGSSGSPVFNAQWKLIGIHHAGGNSIKKLNQKGGYYQANEGIWIQTIISMLKSTFD